MVKYNYLNFAMDALIIICACITKVWPLLLLLLLTDGYTIKESK